MTSTLSRLRLALGLMATILVIATFGYWLLGLSPLDAVYQTVTTITTVGFRELGRFGTAEKVFTLVVIVTGVGTALYTFTLAVQLVVEGQVIQFVGRKRMDHRIATFRNHVVVCGWGRVGKAAARDLAGARRDVVVVDGDPERLSDCELPLVVGDATLDETLRRAGVERAGALVAALAGDAENLFVTLSGRAMNPDLFIVARARQDDSIAKLAQAGADRVVNPQGLGAARMASFVSQPHVAEFVDVVMHERSMEFRMREFAIGPRSALAGSTLRAADVRQAANVLVLAMRRPDGGFVPNPDPDTELAPGDVLIAVGTPGDLDTFAERFG